MLWLYKIATWFLFIPAIISVAYFLKNKSKFSFFFLSFLWITCLVESIGLFIKEENKFTNLWVYNIYTFFEFNLIFFMYLSIIKNKIVVRGIVLSLFLFNIMYLASFKHVFLQDYMVVVGSVIVSFVFLVYFRELLISDEILEYRNKLSFWVTVGFFIYYLTTIPFQLVFNLMKYRKFAIIQIIITIIMHSCFIYGLFICRKEKL